MAAWRKSPLPKNWEQLRKKVIQRDKGLCVLCGRKGSDVDHTGDRNDHRLEMLRLLCKPCHRKRTSSQGGTARALKMPPRRRPSEKHPGLRD